MEVFHFLSPQAGNLIIPPSEIVAKSGGDFDIDKMSVFMPNITKEGEYVNRIYADNEAVKREVESVKETTEVVQPKPKTSTRVRKKQETKE